MIIYNRKQYNQIVNVRHLVILFTLMSIYWVTVNSNSINDREYLSGRKRQRLDPVKNVPNRNFYNRPSYDDDNYYYYDMTKRRNKFPKNTNRAIEPEPDVWDPSFYDQQNRKSKLKHTIDRSVNRKPNGLNEDFYELIAKHNAFKTINRAADVDIPNPICSNNHYDIVGTIYLVDMFIIFTFDEGSKEHIIYLLDTSNVFAFENVALNGSKRFRMQEIFGYDPMKDSKPKKIESVFGIPVYENNQMKNLKVLLLYGEQHHQADILVWKSIVKKPTEHSNTNRSIVAFLLGIDTSGYFLTKNGSEWLMNDVTVSDGKMWIQPGQIPFIIGEDNQHIYLSQDRHEGKFHKVNWKQVNGFIMEDVTVVIFADGYVYMYMDLDEILKHSTSSEYKMPMTKVMYKEYFSCDGLRKEFEFNGLTYDIKPSKAKSRTMTIYFLFLLHFLVAAVMIILIILYSNPSTRDGMNKFTGSNDNDIKRVRKSRKSGKSGIGSSRQSERTTTITTYTTKTNAPTSNTI